MPREAGRGRALRPFLRRPCAARTLRMQNPGPDLAPLVAAVHALRPDLAGAEVKPLLAGWDSVAVEVAGRVIFKFPRHAEAAQRLRREAAVLRLIRPRLTLAVPDMRLHEAPMLCSEHEKLPGDHLDAAGYAALSEPARARLAADMARLFAELHALDPAVLRGAGAGPVDPWRDTTAIRARALPLLSEPLRARAERVLADFARLPPDPCGEVWGYFDGHGWNMAFDHGCGRLNGVYDFADAGFGPLHREFVPPGLVSADLAARVVADYARLTGRAVDVRRAALLGGCHRLSELADCADDPALVPMLTGFFADWAAEA